MKAILSVFAGCSLAAGLGWWYFHDPSESFQEYRTHAVQRGELRVIVAATGRVEPVEVVDVGAQVLGRISGFGFVPETTGETIDYSSKVKKDTVLARIDDALFQRALEEARADLRLAEAQLDRHTAQLDKAKKDWARAQKLGNAISAAERDEFQAAYEIAEADVAIGKAEIDKAKVAVQKAETNLGYATIRSPIDGVVIDRLVDIGQTVVTGLDAPSLFLLANDLSQMQVWAAVSEADIGQIEIGQLVNFKVDAYPDRTFTGKVEQIRLNASTSHNVVTYGVVVLIDDHGGALLPYMTATLKFQIAHREDALLVPNQALLWKPQRDEVVPQYRDELDELLQRTADPSETTGQGQPGVVWVPVGRGLVRPIEIKVGISDYTFSEVLGGELGEDTPVVVSRSESGGMDFGSSFVPEHNILK